ncbi:nicotinate phosphoribosyltransferase [Mycoplasmopsis gallinarum]|nr:nicotinate phosphoribosyltransferase [Mycoplasmopsis gallinarum]
MLLEENMQNKLDKYIASYFLKTTEIIKQINPNNVIKLQFFQRKEFAILAGMQEVLELLKENSDINKYKIKYLPDGSKIKAMEIVLELEGHYQDFGKFEGLIDGILSRATSIATHAYNCINAAKNKKVIFMGDRMDHYLMQPFDGRAVHIGGIEIVSTPAQNVIDIASPFGSVPHALIQNFDGNTAKAMLAYKQIFPNDKIIALVDYHNNVIAQTKEVLEVLGSNLWGIRLDTSKNMKDHMFDDLADEPKYYGVNVEQVKKVREFLDQNHSQEVKIVVSSGFNAEKIAHFEENNAPVDYYGVGQAIFKPYASFSADATMLNGKKQAKEGRFYRENERLIEFN